MSDWLFDLGNSRFKFAPLQTGRAGPARAWAYGSETLDSRELPEGETAWVASVAAPELTEALLQALAQRFARVRRVRTEPTCAGVRIAYAEPARLGVDRFLTLLAAHARGGDALLVGIGTALTIDLLAANGRHLGGRIAASPTTMREALHQRARQLPASGGYYTEFAADTDDALASGCIGAALALIERSRREATDRLGGRPPRLWLHGGGASELAGLLTDAEHWHSMVLDGLAIRVARFGAALDDRDRS